MGSVSYILIATSTAVVAEIAAATQEATGRSDLGPDIRFAATPPTPGDYLLYVDFQVDGRVHTAAFAVRAEAARAGAPSGAHSDGEHGAGH